MGTRWGRAPSSRWWNRGLWLVAVGILVTSLAWAAQGMSGDLQTAANQGQIIGVVLMTVGILYTLPSLEIRSGR
ncbi:hypothetical protein WBK31_11710 [Nonomuraea sp. N2-4H]|uniref:hypothetical protein n=1 Tax=Nonomuraea sp. N2-4H TaxID=3128898 RepID=UPI00324CE278